MADLEAEYRVILIVTLQRRKELNRRYSLRSFARDIGVDNGFLSKLLKGKSLLSLEIADRISKKLKLSSSDRSIFIKSAAEEQQCHALYLLDPTLTTCDSKAHEMNMSPA